MKLKWGVIGAGGIADRRTIPGMLLTDNCELLAVMDTNPELARSVADKYGVNMCFTSAEELVNVPEIQAVYIASPVCFHKAQAMLSAGAGKHILMEKPLAMDTSEAQAVVDYCAAKNVMLAAGFCMRFSSHHRQLKKMLDDGMLGQIVSITGQFTCWYPEIKNAWRQKRSMSGGGALCDMGTHLIDLMQYLTGSKIIEVGAFNERMTFDYEVEDASSLLVKFDAGFIGNINANFNIPDAAAAWRLELFGTQGRITADCTLGQEDGGVLRAVFTGPPGGYDAIQSSTAAKEELYDTEFGNLYAREAGSFSRSVLEGLPLECPGEQAVYVQKVIECAYESSRSGRFVKVD